MPTHMWNRRRDGVAGPVADEQVADEQVADEQEQGVAVLPELAYVVDALSWERVHLRLTLAPDASAGGTETSGLEFVLRAGRRDLPIPATPLPAGGYELHANVTTFAGRRQIPDGTWQIVPRTADGEGPPARLRLDRVETLEQDSRTFLYDGNRTAYVVEIAITEDDYDPRFLLRTYQLFRRTKRPAKSRNPLIRVEKRVASRKNKVRAAQGLLRATELSPIPDRPRILFASEMRPALEGNLLAVRDRMVARGLDKHVELDYSFRMPGSTDKARTAQLLWQLGQADVVLIDDYFPMLESIKLKPTTRVIQLWHAGSGFKSIGFSRFGKYGSPKLQNAHRHYTYAIAGSTHLVGVYAEAFGIEESAVIPTGLPRIDTFLDPGTIATTRTQFSAAHPELVGKKLILFAPTFRGRGFRDAHYPFEQLDFARLYDVLGEDTVFAVRMHHFVNERAPIPPQFADRIIDLTGVGITNDLLHVTDLLITDYSSIIYEYSLLRRPMLFYAYDKDNYAATRGFHRSFDEVAPGRVVTTFNDLLEALHSTDFEEWKVEAFLKENFDHTDCGSSDRVIDQLVLSHPRISAHLRSGEQTDD
ncbi:CDP-glycerol glycerophosphotransferase family protein [Demetria terragena]|uniref:CDP-glycerol glycerophosphotransferase family protein n=1 Tax=Demetria terragena TaxID=63959 RepID=UPI00036B5D46|nr:CDP-glycerol glycerophosphotransferase family protein [Demetria terragena]